MSKSVLMRDLILQELQHEPQTAAQIAATIGEDSMRVYGELRKLWKTGRIDVVNDIFSPIRSGSERERAETVKYRINGNGQAPIAD